VSPAEQRTLDPLMVEAAQERRRTRQEIGAAVRHSAVYSVGSILAKAASFALLPLYTRYLKPSDYGMIELMDFSIAILGMALQLGIGPALLRTYAEAPTAADKNRAVSTTFLFVAATGLVTYLIGLVFIRPVSAMLFGPAVSSKYLLLSFSSFALNYIAWPFKLYLRALEASARLVVWETISSLLVMGLGILFLVGFKMGLMGALLSPLIVNVAWLGLAYGTFFRIGLRGSGLLLRKMLHFGLPLILSNLSVFVLNFADRFFLLHFHTLTAVGLYAVGYKFGFMISVLLVQPFLVMWQTRMYAIYTNSHYESLFNQIFIFYTFTLTYAALGMALFSPEIIHLAAAPEFAPAASVIPLVSLAYVIYGVGTYLQTGMYLTKQTKAIGLIGAISAAFTLVLYYFLIRSYAMLGAAWATVLGFGSLTVLSYWYSGRIGPLRLNLSRVTVVIFIAICLYLPFQLTPPAAPSLMIMLKVLALIGFPVIFWKSRILSPADIAFVSDTRSKAAVAFSRISNAFIGKLRLYAE
jgi:O-antigen/teichoic acid export membrane protein